MNDRGFTLIEMLAVLVLLGILASAATIGISRSARQFNFTKDNAALSQKAQIALNRLLVELTYLDRSQTSMIGAANSITFPTMIATDTGTSATHTFDLNGKNLRFDTYTLCDEIGSFSLQYVTSSGTVTTLNDPTTLQAILVTLVTSGTEGANKTFSAEVAMKF